MKRASFRRLILNAGSRFHTEGRVKRLNLSIDLQMLLTALCVRCHSSHTAERCSPARSMKPLLRVSTLPEGWQAGECSSGVNLHVYALITVNGVYKYIFHAKEDRRWNKVGLKSEFVSIINEVSDVKSQLQQFTHLWMTNIPNKS